MESPIDYLDKLKSFYFDPILKRKIEIIDTLICLVLVALSIICLLSYNFFKYAVTQQIFGYGFVGMFVGGAFLDFVPQLLNPFLVILVGIASGINVHAAVIMVSLGSAAASVFGFELGNAYGPRFIAPLFNRTTMPKILEFWQKHGNIIVLISALTPVPYVPLVFGALKMKRRDLWIYGIIPRVLSFIVVGYGYYFGLFQYNL